MNNTAWIETPESEVPNTLVFHVVGRDQGQIVEVSYANASPSERSLPSPRDAAWKCVNDRSVANNARYYRRKP